MWRIWMERRLDPHSLVRLQAVAEVVASTDLADLPGADAAIISSVVRADATFMELAGPTLKVIARPGIGVDNIDILAATERGILVVNTPDAPSESTAEHAVALLLAVAKRVVMGDNSLRRTSLPREQMLGMQVRERVLGVVGLGRIGRRVAEICAHGLKMRVLGYDPYTDWTQLTAIGVERVDDLHTLLSQADIVTLHVALTPHTRHLIGERELRLMQPGACLINVSRGPVVDERALVRVLQQGHLAGVGLDVFDPEPPPSDHPLFGFPNVVVTPHIASYTDRGLAAMSEGVVDQLMEAMQGVRPAFLLNPRAWPGRRAAAQPGMPSV